MIPLLSEQQLNTESVESVETVVFIYGNSWLADSRFMFFLPENHGDWVPEIFAESQLRSTETLN